MNLHGAILPAEPVTIWVNGAPLEAHRGQSVAAALLANGVRILRHTRRTGKPRGVFCAMGMCFECVLTINGEPGVRACMTPVEAQMQVRLPERFSSLARR